jgi:hypothetical protein
MTQGYGTISLQFLAKYGNRLEAFFYIGNAECILQLCNPVIQFH